MYRWRIAVISRVPVYRTGRMPLRMYSNGSEDFKDINSKSKQPKTREINESSGFRESSDKTIESSNHIEKIKQEIKEKIGQLPSQQEELRTNVSKKVTEYMERIQSHIFNATTLLNDATGYSSIQQLKDTIESLETDLAKAKDDVKKSKQEYTDAIQERSLLQKEVNELLTRKHNWSPEDLERFTELYRNDHANEQNELSAQERLSKAEQLVDSVQLKLTQSILTRYHEEQIWSDKIRRASTWGTWFLMGFNIVLFCIATFIVEPWKRRKMVDSFEDKVKQAITTFSSEQSGKMDTIITNQNKQDTQPQDSPYYMFRLPFHTWTIFKNAVLSNYHALISPEIHFLQFEKDQFTIFISFISLLSCLLSASLTFLLK